jgi:hypothetical protein
MPEISFDKSCHEEKNSLVRQLCWIMAAGRACLVCQLWTVEYLHGGGGGILVKWGTGGGDNRVGGLNSICCIYSSALNNIGAEVAQSKQCLITHWTTGVRSPEKAKELSSSLCFQTSSEAHPVSYPMCIGCPFPGDKARTERHADQSPPSSDEVKNE